MKLQMLVDNIRLKSLELAAIAASTEAERKAVLAQVQKYIDELAAREVAIVEEGSNDA